MVKSQKWREIPTNETDKNRKKRRENNKKIRIADR